MFRLSISQGFGYGKVGVEENHNGCRGLWVWQSLTLKGNGWGFLFESTLLNMWVMWVYIVCVENWCIRYDKIAKHNVSRVSREKALLAKHSQKPIVIICHDSLHSSHVLSTWLHFTRRLFTSYPQKLLWSFMSLESSHSFSHTTLTMKSHIK